MKPEAWMGRLLVFFGAVLAVVACSENGSSAGSLLSSNGRVPCDTLPRQVAEFKQYADKIEEALGTFNDIRVFDRDTKTKEWKLVNGWFVPVTIGGKTPDYYVNDMDSDRPMMLPTTVQNAENFAYSTGQSNPYSSIGRQPGSNPEVQWIWVVRQYRIKKLTEDSFPYSPDMAVIGHHPRTGATAYLQYYSPSCPKPGEVVVAPFSPGGAQFWSPMDSLAPSFKCQRCHTAGPFIHSPWVNQVTIGGGSAPDAPPVEPVVPSDPFGPFFYVFSDSGQPFAGWDSALIASKGGGHFRKVGNKCTQCHRIAPTMLGLNQSSTRYAGLVDSARNANSVGLDAFQNPEYRKMHWMPPVDPYQIDFYAGQPAGKEEDWTTTYEESAKEINVFDDSARVGWKAATAAGHVADIPRPPKEFQTIVVDRPRLDSIAPDSSLWVVDSRIRANTDGDLKDWRFFAKESSSGDVRAAPVVYRRRKNDGRTVQFDVIFVGEAQRANRGGGWLSVRGQTVPIRQGDYLGVVFTNGRGAKRAATIPFTDDDWAVLKHPDGSTWLRDGSVAYRQATPGAPSVGQQITFTDAAFRTYSFEFRNKL